ncbi:MAG: hypothetical protein ABL901_05635 [Hyphomicrobiaceae bacterium]
MKTTGVLAVSASATGFAMATIAQAKAPDESALRAGDLLNQPLSDDLDDAVGFNDEEE